ncbi:ladderlectin-like [Melanotaenia boesemani]|uniref:ladderlectin-like n=1 Tax=Melanotaenia boesemani TaxID=1250792 RepID=UPI001C03EA8F|nr:ladderlectin-like [Melanotaenia boesemani]
MLTVTLLVCGLVAVARTLDDSVEEDPCEKYSTDSWIRLHGRSYLFVPANLTWAEAEKNCRSMQANLVSVHNADENEFINDLIIIFTHSSPRTWIGGSDCQQDNLWLWSDGTDFTFSLWSPGQPDNLNGQEACIQINPGEISQWDDTSCSDLLPSICAKTCKTR